MKAQHTGVISVYGVLELVQLQKRRKEKILQRLCGKMKKILIPTKPVDFIGIDRYNEAITGVKKIFTKFTAVKKNNSEKR